MSIQFYNGVILFVDGQIAMDPACCCVTGCTSWQYGVLDPGSFGWQPAPHVDGTSIRGTFKFEDSANCGGYNGWEQSGYASCTVTFPVSMVVSYRVAGRTERQNAGFDISYIARDGTTMVLIGGSNEYMGCEMADRESVAQETLPAGTYTFTFSADTQDGLYHVGMTHTFLVDWEPA